MNANYIIEASDGRIFAGWNQLGNMVVKPSESRALAYRMSHPVAEKNLPKFESFIGMKCFVKAL